MAAPALRQPEPDLPDDFSMAIWERKYRQSDDQRPHDTFRRVARAVAEAEPPVQRERVGERFFAELASLRFLPGGRILAGAGTGRDVTLLNCFVLGVIEDNMEGIFRGLADAAVTMQRGGGVGLDISTLRPRGTPSRRTGVPASGPVSFLEIFDTSCRVLLSSVTRRGAMMATLRCDHPDVEEFIRVKQSGGLACFNLSVQVTDAFMAAVHKGDDWPLVFPAEVLPEGSGERVRRAWSGRPDGVECRVLRHVPARDLWQLMMDGAHEHGEPGVLFVDRINSLNPLWYREQITTTNPCGEVPLPPHGACDLGSLNLVRFVNHPFTTRASFDFDALERSAAVAVRFLDDVLDVTRYPLMEQEQTAHGTRRVGLGVTGLADALILLGRRYDSAEGRAMAMAIFEHLRNAAFRASIALAHERGPFPFYDPELFPVGPFIRALPDSLRDGIVDQGLRNAQLLAVAPAGTISLLAGNVSTGVEPLFALAWRRRLVERDGSLSEHPLSPYALKVWRAVKGTDAPLPRTFVDAQSMSADAQLEMLAALQPFVDGAISKTINLPEAGPVEPLFERAYALGLKGCTVFPKATWRGAVLSR